MPAQSYRAAAPRLLEHGYEPLPILQGTKRPGIAKWSTVRLDGTTIDTWIRDFPYSGVGLRTGRLVGINIDILDADLAHDVGRLVQARLGETLMRVGRWPKRLLVYRMEVPFAKLSCKGLEVLGRGQQFVAFGIHEATRLPYHWPLGETPLDVPLDELPLVDEAACRDVFHAAATRLSDARGTTRTRSHTGRTQSSPLHRDAGGLVVDGRDGWLSAIAFHAVHDQLDAGRRLDEQDLAAAVWQRFAASADLQRPRKYQLTAYGPEDAARKVGDKLRLLGEGRLPPRERVNVEARHVPPVQSAEEAREALDRVLREACGSFAAWHRGEQSTCPRIAIRATVGLGKSVAARRHLLALREALIESGAPSRIVVFTPSHVLAEEAAAAWRQHVVKVAVLGGYKEQDPATRHPVCREPHAVRAAIAAGVEVHSAACVNSRGMCRSFDGCLKQENRRHVDEADVVFASYDALFTGFHTDHQSFGILLIDEGCWQRAVTEVRGLRVEDFGEDLLDVSLGHTRTEREQCRLADLVDLRRKAAAALAANGPGPLRREELLRSGLTAITCREAVALEEHRLDLRGLYPGAAQAVSDKRMRVNERTQAYAAVWDAMADLLESEEEQDGRITIRDAGASSHEIIVVRPKSIHHRLAGKPILHLDATFRSELASTFLGKLETHEIDASAPHMSVRLVSGSFGKNTLCQDSRAATAENLRRANRLSECVSYVRWQAARARPQRTLVITYLGCESAFRSIPDVEVAHFNAIAGLDVYRNVRSLIVIGRPLLRDQDLAPLCGAFFSHHPQGGYHHIHRGVRMRNGSSCSVRVIEHQDRHAEILRAAICDDELIQAIGRGRGVNRTAEDPLEVHVLADVALPLVHDSVTSWDDVKPEIVQRMLLAGIAVYSPSDATALHSVMFETQKQAQKTSERAAFGRKNSIRDTYRENVA